MYTEFPEAVDGVRCTWQRWAGGGKPLIVPDGCVDLVWFSDGRFEVAGPDTAARHVQVTADLEIVGVRFAPATARRLIGVPIGELCDQQPAMTELNERMRLAARTLEEGSHACMATRRNALTLLAARAEGQPNDALVQAAVRQLEHTRSIRIGALADDLGVSARQLQRRFVDEVGYAPKTFARIVRLRRLLGAAAASSDLASAALAAGFASQAHMSDEVRALTSLTAVRFLEDHRGWSP